MIKLKAPNPHVALGTMQKMKKFELLAAIHSEDILNAGMILRKQTLIDWLNWELLHDVDAPDIPITFHYKQEKP